jgi:hypothetical protein
MLGQLKVLMMDQLSPAGATVDVIRWASIVLSFPNSIILVIIHDIVCMSIDIDR